MPLHLQSDILKPPTIFKLFCYIIFLTNYLHSIYFIILQNYTLCFIVPMWQLLK